jgi:nucleoside-diphosphate-sugar epimerase
VDALVIGGTGPTGPFIVNGLLARGYRVAMLHTGAHEIDEIPESVEHIHTDPYDADALRGALGERTFDVCIATYGRLRRIAEIMVGRCGKFISAGGGPAYRGYMNPALWGDGGMPVPIPEDAPRVEDPVDDEKGFRIARTEDAVLEQHPTATHFRYPIVYGPRQLLPREWCVIRRALDRRPHILLPAEGLTLLHCGYVENVAHAVMLAVDRPDVAAGKIYNCADSECLTLRQMVEVIAEALGHRWEIVSLPWSLAKPARPLVMQPLPTHRLYDLGRLRVELGYRDVVPAREAWARTARWWAERPIEPGALEETILLDPFDYAAEDLLVERWKRALAGIEPVAFSDEPGYTLAYSGPGGRTSSSSEFE